MSIISDKIRIIGSVTAINADCMDLMKDIPDKYFDLAICDPPYGINASKMPYTRSENSTCVQKNGSKLAVKKNAYAQKEWDANAPELNYFRELTRVSRNQIIWGIDYFKWNPGESGRIKWNKGFSKNVSFKGYESAYCSFINGIREVDLLWAGFMQAKSLDEPMIQQGNKRKNQKRIHPTEKPKLLYKRLLIDYAESGCKILDTHGGSMSHGLAANELGMDLTIIESDADYFELATNRLEHEYNIRYM